MKKSFKYVRNLMLMLVIFCMTLFGVCVASAGKNAIITNASTSASTDYFSIDYENNELKILINADVVSFKNISKDDLILLEETLKSALYEIVLEDVSFTNNNTTKQKNRIIRKADMPVNPTGIDTSIIEGIIEGKLSNVETIHYDFMQDGVYDNLFKIYVDRYTDTYISSNPEDEVNDVLDRVAEQFSETIQETINQVYQEAGEEVIPDVSAKVQQLVEEVKEVKENDGKINITINDVTEIFNVVSDANDLVDVIKSIDIKDEVNTIITETSVEEIKSFLTNVDLGVVSEVAKEVEVISKEDVKEVLNKFSTEDLIEVVSSAGIDSFKDFASNMDFSQEDFDEIIDQMDIQLSIGTIISILKGIKIDGNYVYNDGSVVASGLVEVIKALPRLNEIANYTDEQMNLSWNVVIETALGDVDFKLTVGLFGDSSAIRRVLGFIADHFSLYVEEGTYHVDVIFPEILSSFYKKALNSDVLSKELKERLFNLFSLKVEELYQEVQAMTLEEVIDILQTLDYKAIVSKLLDANTWNSALGTTAITNEKIDKLITYVLSAVGKVGGLSYEKVNEYVNTNLGFSLPNNSKVEKLVNKVFNLISKLDNDKLSAEKLREFASPNSRYTNEDVYNYIEKLNRFESQFETAKTYLEKVYNYLPESILDKSLADFYVSSESFDVSKTINFRNVIDFASRFIGTKLTNAIKLLVGDVSENTISIHLNTPNLYKVEYVFGNNTLVGILPEGASLSNGLDFDEVDGYKIVKWIDESNVEYTQMPSHDIKLFAVTAFEVEVSPNINKVFDNSFADIYVNVNPVGEYTYEWYKDGVLLPEMTTNSINVGYVNDSGEYYCVVSSEHVTITSDVITVAIEKATIDLSETAWSTPNNFVYDGSYHMVEIVNVPTIGNIVYNDQVKAINAGTYVASATYELGTLEDNYNVVGSLPADLTWTIDQQEINTDYAWDYTNPFTYDGNPHTVKLVNVSDKVSVSYEFNTFTNVSTYTATATITPVDAVNYKVSKSALTLSWAINQQEINTDYAWDYTNPFTYDGNPHTVKLVNVSDKVSVSYESNTFTNVSTYTATATITPVDAVNYKVSKSTLTLSWAINQQEINTNDYSWDYTNPFTYDGNPHTVKLVNVSDKVSVSYESNTFTNASTYTATATITPVDAVNYKVSKSALTLSWKINQAEISLENITWDYINPFTYDGNTHTVSLQNYPNTLLVSYENNQKVDAGNYQAVATLVPMNDNYKLANLESASTTVTLDWAISAKSIDVSGLTWNYSAPFNYDGNEHSVVLNDVPELLQVTYTNNTAIEAGKYTARATFVSSSTNYVVSGEVAPLNWEIVANEEEHTWNYNNEVFVTSPNGLPTEYQLVVVDKTEEMDEFNFAPFLNNNQTAEVLKVYDISFAIASVEQKVTGEFTVKISVPASYKSMNLIVVHIGDTESTVVESSFDGDYLQITTNDFSVFVIGSVTTKAEQKTIPWFLWVIIGVLIAVIACLVIYLLSKHTPSPKNNTPEAEENKEVEMDDSYYVALTNSSEENRSFYEIIKDHLLSYGENDNKVQSIISGSNEVFNSNNEVVAKFKMRNGKLVVILPLEQSEYLEQDKVTDEASVFTCNVKNTKRCKYVCEMVTKVMSKLNIEKAEVVVEEKATEEEIVEEVVEETTTSEE